MRERLGSEGRKGRDTGRESGQRHSQRERER